MARPPSQPIKDYHGLPKPSRVYFGLIGSLPLFPGEVLELCRIRRGKQRAVAEGTGAEPWAEWPTWPRCCTVPKQPKRYVFTHINKLICTPMYKGLNCIRIHIFVCHMYTNTDIYMYLHIYTCIYTSVCMLRPCGHVAVWICPEQCRNQMAIGWMI